MRTYGISTHLYHGKRLTREHLQAIAAHGFDRVELCATRSHVDYHNPSAIADLQQWLAEAGLELHSVHAPSSERFPALPGESPFSLASADAARRERALAEAEQALFISRRIPFKALVLHLGVSRTVTQAAGDNSRDAARRSVETLAKLAAPLGVTLALEVIANDLSRAPSLVHFIEEVVDAEGVGICLDFGHAHLDRDVVDTVELVSEHLVDTHLHDNRGRTDDHLVPFDGSIDWPGALTAIQKVGYDGTLVLEVKPHGPEQETLKKARAARQRIEDAFVAW